MFMVAMVSIFNIGITRHGVKDVAKEARPKLVKCANTIKPIAASSFRKFQ